MKVLNLYCGIGGNRKLWKDVEVTAVEIDPRIALEYRRRFPQDKVIVGDAHEYLLNNFERFDFIWSSPPCQTHSRTNYFLKAQGTIRFADMKLYEEIIFLQTHFKGKWVVENVIPYYKPLIPPRQIGRHCLWSNFLITGIGQPKDNIGKMCGKNQTAHNKPIEERNEVNKELGAHILRCAFKQSQQLLGN